MFNSRLVLSPEAPVAAPPVAPAAPAYSSPSIDDIFNDVSDKWLPKEDITTETMINGDRLREASIDEMLEGMGDEPVEGEATEGESEEGSEKTTTEETTENVEEVDNKGFKYKFKGDVDGQEYDIDFTDPKQLDTVVKQALYGKKIHAEHKELTARHTEVQNELAKSEADWEALEQKLANDPVDFLETFTEDMPEEQVRMWMQRKLDEWTQPPEVQSHNRLKKQYERMLKDQETLAEQATVLKQREEQANLQQERQTYDNWGVQTKNKITARFPELPSAIIDQTIEAAAMTAGQLKRQGKKITVETLNDIFVAKMKPIVELHNSYKTGTANSSKQVQAQVGKAIQDKKEQTMQRIQNTSNPARRNAQNNIQDKYRDDPMKVFDLLTDMVGSGKANFRLSN
jgi:hypothetical protein